MNFKYFKFKSQDFTHGTFHATILPLLRQLRPPSILSTPTCSPFSTQVKVKMNALLNGNRHLAYSWIPPPGAIVFILLIRVSPNEYIHIYMNDGIGQILQMVMGKQLFQEICPDSQCVLYPAVFADMQKSRHEPESLLAIHQVACAVSSRKP